MVAIQLPPTEDWENPPEQTIFPAGITFYPSGTVFEPLGEEGKIGVRVWWKLANLFGLVPVSKYDYGNGPKEFAWVAYPLVRELGQEIKADRYDRYVAICKIKGVKSYDILPPDVMQLIRHDESYPCMKKDLLKERLKLAKALFSDLPGIEDSMWEGMSDEDKDLVAHLIAMS